MCGITGIAGHHPLKDISKMNELQTHRGPDDSGEFLYEGHNFTIQLAMRRLVIVDEHGGCQPMTSDDGKFSIVFNGEIFNASELRTELDRVNKFHFKSSHSDTEVLMYALIYWGEDCLSKINGMFSFAFWNQSKQELLCAIDRFGIKPLYYLERGNGVTFSSELKSFFADKRYTYSLDENSLFDFLSLRYVMGEDSIIKGVKRLLPGQKFKWKPNSALRIDQWFIHAIGTSKERNRVVIQHEILSRFKNAVNNWSISDVPIGCALSGGLDSSAVVGALCSAGKDLRTFSLGFADIQDHKINELDLARKTAQKWGLKHHEILIRDRDLIDDLLLIVWHLDEPYAGGLPSWWVFKDMRNYVKVAMTGVGGDELFGNYGKWWGFESKFSIRSRKRHFTFDEFRDNFFNRRLYFTDQQKLKLFSKQDKYDSSTAIKMHRLLSDKNSKSSVRDLMTLLDLETQLPFEFLFMTDRFSMAHSIEARTPFLDNDLSTYVLGLNSNLRTKRRDLKYLFRDSVSDLLIHEVMEGRKKGFELPLNEWIKGILRPHIEYFLSSNRVIKQGIFKSEEINLLLETHFKGKKNNAKYIWIIFMFQLWHFIYIENDGKKPNFTITDVVSSAK